MSFLKTFGMKIYNYSRAVIIKTKVCWNHVRWKAKNHSKILTINGYVKNFANGMKKAFPFRKSSEMSYLMKLTMNYELKKWVPN